MKRVSTQYLLTCAAIGAAGGILLIPANNVAAAVAAALPLLYAAIVGAWVIASVIALDVIRRPGASLLTSLFAGLVVTPFTPYGARSIITCVLFGALLELPFLATLYRRWHPALFFAATLGIGAVYSVFAYRTFAIDTFPIGAQIAFFAILLASIAAFTAVGLVIGSRLRAAGIATALRRRPAAA
ncbi:ECF transporter S component [Schumannella luteola]